MSDQASELKVAKLELALSVQAGAKRVSPYPSKVIVLYAEM